MAENKTKMMGFVHFNGTKAQFIEKGYESTYANAIVFIKGDAEGHGSAIYTHSKYYASIAELEAVVGNLSSLQQSFDNLKVIKGIKVNGGDPLVSTSHDGIINFTSDSPVVSLSTDPTGVKISLDSTFVNKVNSAATKESVDNIENVILPAHDTRMGNIEKSVSDLTKKHDDEIAAQNTLNGTFATKNDLNGVDSRVQTLESAITTKVEQEAYNTKVAELTKAIADNSTADQAKAAQLADAAQAAAEKHADDLNSAMDIRMDSAEAALIVLNGEATTAGSVKKALADANTYTDNKVEAINSAASTLTNRVKTNEDNIAALQEFISGSEGEDLDSRINAAIEAFAGIADNDKVIENVVELIEYVSGVDGSEPLANVIAQVNSNKAALDSLNTGANSVDKKIEAAVEALETADANLQSSINGLTSQMGEGTVDSRISTAKTEAQNYAAGLVNALDVTDTAVANKYVSAVSQADGKITVTRADLPTYTLVTGDNNGQVKFNGTNVAVQGLKSAAYTEVSDYATAAQGAKADSAYQKAAAGIPLTDLTAGVQASLAKADAAAPQATTYTKDEVNTIKTNLEAACAAMWVWEEL